MRMTDFKRRVSLVIVFGLGIAVSPAARPGDIADIVTDVALPITGITTVFDCQFGGFCGATLADSLVGLNLDSLSSVTSGVVNQRIVPLSSSVSGFTYDYNADLDVYDRSTKTFGPLFSERAQTIGKKRFLVGMSESYLEFDEFNGDDLNNISLSELGGDLETAGANPTFQGVTLVSFAGVNPNQALDVDLDLNIKEWASTMYFTYGLTERIDVGVVVPFLRIKADASARVRSATGSSELPACNDPTLDVLANATDLCLGTSGATASNSESETFFGIGDTVVRGKWNFFVGVANAAFTAEATIPTGDPDNLTGLHTMTYRPGIVVSKDFETPMGGLGLQSYAGYNFRPDEPDQQQFDWAVGAAIQPLGRASISLDLLGSNQTRGAENFILDGSVGLKVMLAQNALLDFNWIAPLNNDGLRPSAGIFTIQLEGTFGD